MLPEEPKTLHRSGLIVALDPRQIGTFQRALTGTVILLSPVKLPPLCCPRLGIPAGWIDGATTAMVAKADPCISSRLWTFLFHILAATVFFQLRVAISKARAVVG